ncbi:MAG: zf-HC2 domain-containing protein [Clostridia bacterium]|nr:zf-HC2 domain-containing protein [Clostridia bacterium]
MKENPCKEYLILMQAVLDGEAPPSNQAKWREHAASCKSCQALFDELVSLKKAIPGTMAEPPYGLDETILKKIHTEDKQRKLHTINRRQNTFRSVMGVAAALAILVVGSWTLSRYGGKAVETEAADNAFMMETEEKVVLEAEATPEEPTSDIGSAESDMEYSSQSYNSATGTTVLEDGNALTDRAEILDVLRAAASGLNLPGSYKACIYLDCDNLPQDRDQYLVSPKTNVARTILPYDLTFYSTDDYLGFINGAGLELNFSLELTESEMRDCGLATGGDLTMVVVATPMA